MNPRIDGYALFVCVGVSVTSLQGVADRLPVRVSAPVAKVVPMPSEASKKLVDVVFVLDTTGSMSGMIDGAKRKIWEIAQFFTEIRPHVRLRVGVVAYRDRGDEYITKRFPLTEDLDGVYEFLSALRADGGGDWPEHVSQALTEAVKRSDWSSDAQAFKVVFLVGDAPPQTRYQDGFDYIKAAQSARKAGILINAIRCGNAEDTQKAWTRIAEIAGGEVSTIEQSGGVAVVSTPFDGELASLNQKLADTAVVYGDRVTKERDTAKMALARAASSEVQADRAETYAKQSMDGRARAVGGSDLVIDVQEGKIRPYVAREPSASSGANNIFCF